MALEVLDLAEADAKAVSGGTAMTKVDVVSLLYAVSGCVMSKQSPDEDWAAQTGSDNSNMAQYFSQARKISAPIDITDSATLLSDAGTGLLVNNIGGTMTITNSPISIAANHEPDYTPITGTIDPDTMVDGAEAAMGTQTEGFVYNATGRNAYYRDAIGSGAAFWGKDTVVNLRSTDGTLVLSGTNSGSMAGTAYVGFGASLNVTNAVAYSAGQHLSNNLYNGTIHFKDAAAFSAGRVFSSDFWGGYQVFEDSIAEGGNVTDEPTTLVVKNSVYGNSIGGNGFASQYFENSILNVGGATFHNTTSLITDTGSLTLVNSQVNSTASTFLTADKGERVILTLVDSDIHMAEGSTLVQVNDYTSINNVREGFSEKLFNGEAEIYLYGDNTITTLDGTLTAQVADSAKLTIYGDVKNAAGEDLEIPGATIVREGYGTLTVKSNAQENNLYVINGALALTESVRYDKYSGVHITEKADISAPEGKAVVMTVDGVQVASVYSYSWEQQAMGPGGGGVSTKTVDCTIPADTYTGNVVLEVVDLVSDIYDSHGSQTEQFMTVALSIGEDGVVAGQSAVSALVGVNYTGTKASGGTITSTGDYFGGIRVGGDAEYLIENITFDLTGNGGNDFTGIGAAVAAVDNAKVTVRNCKIVTSGALRGAFFAGDNAELLVENCTVETRSLWSESDPDVLAEADIPTAGMSVPPAGLGVYGNNRSTNVVDTANVTYKNCTIKADSWGAMGSDDISAAPEEPVYMTLTGCTIEVENAGYGAYAIGYIWDVLDDTDIIADNGMGVIVAAEGSARLTNHSTITSNRFGIVTHQGMGSVSNIVVTGGTSISAKNTGILVKERATNIEISDGATISSKDGVLIQAVVNDDKGAGSLMGGEVIDIAVKDVQLQGDVLQSLPDVPMEIALSGASITGAVSMATPTFLNGGNAGSGVEDRYDVGIITANKLEAVKDTQLNLTLADGSVWTVTEDSYLTSLTLDDEDALRGTGTVHTAALTVDGRDYADGTYTLNGVTVVVEKFDFSISFTDVADDAWYAEAVAFVVDKELFNGTSDTTFSPMTNMSRSMLATVLYRLAGSPMVMEPAEFPDVEAGAWYTDAVAWASANDVVKGIDGGLFGTTNDVTRQEIATMLYRYAQKNGRDVSASKDLSAFSDGASTADWALQAMQWAVAEGLIEGSGGRIMPTAAATRAEVATILMRFCQL